MADNFTPGETVPLTATTSGAQTSFTLSQSANYPDCLISNAGSVTAFVGFGAAAAQPAQGATNATPVLPGETMVLRKGSGVTAVSAMTATGTAQLYFTAGEGS
jgi:hypothetical protein